jgi:hypothetical protein
MSMKNVTQLIVRTAELLEAEGRAARDVVRAESREFKREAGRFLFPPLSSWLGRRSCSRGWGSAPRGCTSRWCR